MPIFRKELLEKVLQGRKTQTRRIHKHLLKVGRTYGVRCRRFDRSVAHIRILRASQERLGDITAKDAKNEGFATVEEFHKDWVQIYGSWDPNRKVMVYDFQLEDVAKTGKPSSATTSQQP